MLWPQRMLDMKAATSGTAGPHSPKWSRRVGTLLAWPASPVGRVCTRAGCGAQGRWAADPDPSASGPLLEKVHPAGSSPDIPRPDTGHTTSPGPSPPGACGDLGVRPGHHILGFSLSQDAGRPSTSGGPREDLVVQASRHTHEQKGPRCPRPAPRPPTPKAGEPSGAAALHPLEKQEECGPGHRVDDSALGTNWETGLCALASVFIAQNKSLKKILWLRCHFNFEHEYEKEQCQLSFAKNRIQTGRTFFSSMITSTDRKKNSCKGKRTIFKICFLKT